MASHALPRGLLLCALLLLLCAAALCWPQAAAAQQQEQQEQQQAQAGEKESERVWQQQREDDGVRAMCALLDHDNDGTISPSESPLDNLDRVIHLHELEQLWEQNPARKWDTKKLSSWATETVSPAVGRALQDKGFAGRDLPQLASNNDVAYELLQVKSRIDRHRLAARAYDLVIFGPEGRIAAHDVLFAQLLPIALLVLVGTVSFIVFRGRLFMVAPQSGAAPPPPTITPVPSISEVQPATPEIKDRHRSISSVTTWTPMDVSDWLATRGYEELLPQFDAITGKELLGLSKADLMNMGVSDERATELLEDISALSELLQPRRPRSHRKHLHHTASTDEALSDVFITGPGSHVASSRTSEALLSPVAAQTRGHAPESSPTSTGSDSPASHLNSAFSTLNTDGSNSSSISTSQQPVTMHLTHGIFGKISEAGLEELESAELVLLRKIGTGQFGSVWRSRWSPKPKQGAAPEPSIVAAKILTNVSSTVDSDTRKHFEREMNMLSSIRHQNIVELLGASTTDHIIILTSYCNAGSLFSFLHGEAHASYNLKWVHRISREIAMGLNYLVTKHILHRDLKSHNILLHADSVPATESANCAEVSPQALRACICDFGLARHADHMTKMTGTPGTPAWMAPEVIRNEPVDDKCDVYSYGIVLWELLTRQTPWEGMEPAQVMFSVAAYDRRPPLPPECPAAFAQLITACWHKTPKLRPSFQEIEDILLTMPPIMIYGQSSALDGVDDLAMSQANWGKIIQDKLKEFHQAEDLLKVKDVEIDKLRKEIMELQARHEELRRKGIQRMRGDTINLAMLGRANLPPAALRPVGGGDRQQLRKRVSKGNAARNSVELDESTGSDHGVHDTSASPEAEHSLSSAAAGIAAEDRPSRLPPFPGSRLLGGTYLTARKRSATNPAPFLY